MCAVVIVGQSLDVISGEASIMDFLAIYIGLLFFLALWGGHKLVTRTPKVKPEEADLSRHI